MRLPLFCALILSFTLTSPMYAQEVKKGLSGIQSVKILIEDLDSDAKTCGLSTGGLDAAVRLPVDASRLRINPSAVGTYIYVNVIAVYLKALDACVAQVDVELNRPLTLPNSDTFVIAAVWNDGVLLTGEKISFPSRVYVAVTDKTKQLIGAWITANPRK